MKKLTQFAIVVCAPILVAGCSSIGNAPSGASVDQVKAELQQEPPLQQIRNIMFSPMPAAQREAQIKAIEDKYHVSRNDAMNNLPKAKFSNQAPPEVPTGH